MAAARQGEGTDGPENASPAATPARHDPWLWMGLIAWLAMMAFFFYLRDVERAPESTLRQDSPGAAESGDSTPK